MSELVRPLYDAFAKWGPEIPMDLIRETTRYHLDKFAVSPRVEVRGRSGDVFRLRASDPEATRVETRCLKSITFEFITCDARTVQIFHKGEGIVLRLFGELYENAKAKRPDRFLLFPRASVSACKWIATTRAHSLGLFATTSPQ